MKDITTADSKSFEALRFQNRVYKTGVYAFTLEHAYLIYYYKRAAGKGKFQYDYIAADIRTGTGSHVCSRKSVLSKNYFTCLIPSILRSIKYTGDKRGINASKLPFSSYTN